MELVLGTTEVELLPSRALLLPASKTLIIADLHLGKSATFRRRGLPIPEGTTQSDLDRLTRILEKSAATHLLIAGDLVHSADGLTSSVIDTFQNWLAELAIPVTLTEGNHDARAWLSSRKLPLQIVPSLTIAGLLITHDPIDLPPGQPGIAGHLHPGAKIGATRRNPLRLPGFYLKNKEHLILPAFSEFTGIHPIKFTPNDHFYTELNGHISEIPPSLLR